MSHLCPILLVCTTLQHQVSAEFLPTQMVLVESSLLPSEHSQLKDPATLRHTPLTHGLERHSLMSETRAHPQSAPRG